MREIKCEACPRVCPEDYQKMVEKCSAVCKARDEAIALYRKELAANELRKKQIADLIAAGKQLDLCKACAFYDERRIAEDYDSDCDECERKCICGECDSEYSEFTLKGVEAYGNKTHC